MVKFLYVLFNTGIIMALSTLFGDVDIQYSLPSQVNSGSQFTVEYSINKGEVDRYARFTVEVPNGINVTAKENAGGQFSFSNQQAIIHWYNLPYDEVLKVTLVFTVAPAISGEVSIKGSFKYIDDNKIQEKIIGADKILIDQVEGVTDLLASQRYKYRDITLKPIDCIRQKPFMNENNEIEVNLLVSKNDLSSFGKIEEQLPRGYKAVATRTKGAIFQVSGRIVKFMWMELPKNEKMFLVSYKLIQTENYDQAFIINGSFSYSQYDRTLTTPIVERNIDLSEFAEEELLSQELTKDEQMAELAQEKEQQNKTDVLADNENFTGISGLATTSALESLKDTNLTYEQTLTEEEREYYAKNPQQTLPSGTLATNGTTGELRRQAISSTPGAEQGISFKVQIAASHKLVSKDYFKKFKINDPVHIELHDGWHKYTIGNFKVYKEARDHRVQVWNTTPVSDAFVSAYSSGYRITVQEALMIANQQWFK